MTVLHHCESCGAELKCAGCDDVRPTANDLYEGWRLQSPLDRWETVTRTEQQGGEYGPIRVWTDQTGADYSWRYHRTARVTATPPAHTVHGTPEIRVVEFSWRTGPMYAIPTLSTIYRPGLDNYLVEAHHDPGGGWTVRHRPDGGGTEEVITCESKAKARSALRGAARSHARVLGVKVVIGELK